MCPSNPLMSADFLNALLQIPWKDKKKQVLSVVMSDDHFVPKPAVSTEDVKSCYVKIIKSYFLICCTCSQSPTVLQECRA